MTMVRGGMDTLEDLQARVQALEAMLQQMQLALCVLRCPLDSWTTGKHSYLCQEAHKILEVEGWS